MIGIILNVQLNEGDNRRNAWKRKKNIGIVINTEKLKAAASDPIETSGLIDGSEKK